MTRRSDHGTLGPGGAFQKVMRTAETESDSFGASGIWADARKTARGSIDRRLEGVSGSRSRARPSRWRGVICH